MINGSVFRPWGTWPWVTGKLSLKNWNLIGCLSPEERCLGIIYHLNKNKCLLKEFLIEVMDPESDYSEISAQKKETHKAKIESQLSRKINIEKMKLFVSPKTLKYSLDLFIKKTDGNVVLDISTFPKRFFFPIVNILIKNDEVKNLLITYTLPVEYHDGDLAEEPLPWDHIPRFQNTEHPTPHVKNAVVGVGFLPFGLPELLKDDYSDAEVKLIFPYPPGPPNYQRTWEFVRKIETFSPLESNNQIIRVDILDLPGCYKHLCALGRDGDEYTIFAPYGPKTHSLAMCLYATKYNCEVFYTQPKFYHPDYSKGISYVDALPETYAYCIKVNGNNLY